MPLAPARLRRGDRQPRCPPRPSLLPPFAAAQTSGWSSATQGLFIVSPPSSALFQTSKPQGPLEALRTPSRSLLQSQECGLLPAIPQLRPILRPPRQALRWVRPPFSPSAHYASALAQICGPSSSANTRPTARVVPSCLCPKLIPGAGPPPGNSVQWHSTSPLNSDLT